MEGPCAHTSSSMTGTVTFTETSLRQPMRCCGANRKFAGANGPMAAIRMQERFFFLFLDPFSSLSLSLLRSDECFSFCERGAGFLC